MLKGKTIILGVGGGIAAYKAAELTREFVEGGAEVRVMMTRAAGRFMTPLTFHALSGHPVATDLFEENPARAMEHITLATEADLVVIAPATADLIARAAHGLCDDIVTTVLCATQAPQLFVPAMNVHMWNNPITQDNVARLRNFGRHVLEPDEGALACGAQGKGRLPDPEKILSAVRRILK